MNNTTLSLFCTLVIGAPHTITAQPLTVSSPGNIVQVSFVLERGVPHYSVSRLGREVIRQSKLGFVLRNAPPLDRGFKVTSSEQGSFDETWTQPWGEKKDIRNNYNELCVVLTETSSRPRTMTMVFRAYDDGIGFRYEIPEQQNLTSFEIMDELTEFALTDDHMAWWFAAYQWNRYEYLYTRSPVSMFDTVHTPLTMETKDGLHLSFHEAALVDYASMTLERTRDQVLKANLVPWSDGTKVKAAAPMKSPWRTIQMSDTPGGLITSYLILNLNEPNTLGDVSWVKPGKYVGIWWEMHVEKSTWGSGPKHGATTDNARRYIDFAAEYGFDGVLIEGWNVGWDTDWTKHGDQFQFTTPYPDFDIKEVARYAAEKGVRIIGHHETGGAVMNYERQMSDAFAYYERLGVRQVKTGYVQWGTGIKRIDEHGRVQGEWHHGQHMVRHHQKVVEEAAKHRISINIHEPIKDTGLRRTYPNLMTREGARGQEYDAWSADGGNPPDHTTILPFTRLLSGPMDFTPGIFDLFYDDLKPNNRVNTTLAKQLAHYVIIYSPLQMAADFPENYEARPGPFKFIVDVPADWADTRVIHARIGDYVTIARLDRNSADWYLGSITDEYGRVLEAPLSFLDKGTTYLAQIYGDGLNADWVMNPYDIGITEMLVDNSTTLTLRLAPGGGQAIRFTPATKADIDRLSR
jgi:alpha-glucosidase